MSNQSSLFSAVGAPTATAPTSQTAPIPALGGFTFGAPTTTTSQTAPAPTPASGGFTFGTPTATITQSAPAPAPGGFTFGTTPTTTTQTAPALGGFNIATSTSTIQTTPAPAVGGFTFGAPTTTTQTAPAPALGGFNIGTSTSTSLTTPTPAPGGFTFGAPITTTTQTAPASSLGGFNIGTSTSTSQATPASAPGGFTFGTAASQTTVTPATGIGAGVGLGGIPNQANTDNAFPLSTAAGNGIKPEHHSSKDQALPPELLVLVEEFKNHMKNDRVKLTEVSVATGKSVEVVSDFCDEVRQTVCNVTNVNHRQMLNLEAIRNLINQDIRDAEAAHLIKDTPISLQQNYQFPMQYLFRMIKDFEDRIVVYQREITKSEAALAAGSGSFMSGKELFTALQGSKMVLIVLAARIKTLHEKVAHELETHQNLLHSAHGDLTKDTLSDKQKIQPHVLPRYGLPFPDEPREELKKSSMFASRAVDPSKMYMNYLAASKRSTSPSGIGFGYHSPLNYNSSNVLTKNSYETSPMTGSSTFYHHNIPMNPMHNIPITGSSQNINPAMSLKRSKH